MITPILEVRNLSKEFSVNREGIFGKRTHFKAVDDVSFDIAPGESLGLVGESGCGKTTTCRLITKLIEPTSGTIRFQGEEITRMTVKDMRSIRRDVQMIFQDPFSSLNPRHTVGTIIKNAMKINQVNAPQGLEARVKELLEIVGLNPEHINRYPHEFSGGQRQRIGIARAI